MMPIKLRGTVVSSGCLIAENGVADWAFVEFSKEVINSAECNLNRMPSVPRSDPHRNPADYEAVGLVLEEAMPLVEFGSLQAGEWYCKSGRTTKVTGGICDGASSYCNWLTDVRVRLSKDGLQRATIQEGVTEEWVITTEGEPAMTGKSRVLSAEGRLGLRDH
ncbi:uncharacterized protein BJX67DRAFT_304036 [Aspergillus lucknowensis]|uniref:Uncharacterized protein n=1 Tax=Aspergillus lucknowensis TaxID=176173 RepID=A0ABR4LZY7_9EURO